MEAISSVMSSGVFNDILANMNDGLSDGSLDISKLMQSVTGMISGLSTAAGTDGSPQNEAISGMMNTMMASMKDLQEGGTDGSPPDLSKLINPLVENLQKLTPADGKSSGGGPDIAKMLGPLLSSLSAISKDGDIGGSSSGGLISNISNPSSAIGSDGKPNIMGIIGNVLGGDDRTLEQKIDDEVARARKSGKIQELTE